MITVPAYGAEKELRSRGNFQTEFRVFLLILEDLGAVE